MAEACPRIFKSTGYCSNWEISVARTDDQGLKYFGKKPLLFCVGMLEQPSEIRTLRFGR